MLRVYLIVTTILLTGIVEWWWSFVWIVGDCLRHLPRLRSNVTELIVRSHDTIITHSPSPGSSSSRTMTIHAISSFLIQWYSQRCEENFSHKITPTLTDIGLYWAAAVIIFLSTCFRDGRGWGAWGCLYTRFCETCLESGENDGDKRHKKRDKNQEHSPAESRAEEEATGLKNIWKRITDHSSHKH